MEIPFVEGQRCPKCNLEIQHGVLVRKDALTGMVTCLGCGIEDIIARKLKPRKKPPFWKRLFDLICWW